MKQNVKRFHISLFVVITCPPYPPSAPPLHGEAAPLKTAIWDLMSAVSLRSGFRIEAACDRDRF